MDDCAHVVPHKYQLQSIVMGFKKPVVHMRLGTLAYYYTTLGYPGLNPMSALKSSFLQVMVEAAGPLPSLGDLICVLIHPRWLVAGICAMAKQVGSYTHTWSPSLLLK